MTKKEDTLAHTKWICEYHMDFTPEYRRKMIDKQFKADIRDDIKQLCSYEGVEITADKMRSQAKNILSDLAAIDQRSAEIKSERTFYDG